MARSGPSPPSSVYNSADEIEPAVASSGSDIEASDSASCSGGDGRRLKALLIEPPHERRRRLCRQRNGHPPCDTFGPPEPTWASRLLRYFSPSGAIRRSIRPSPSSTGATADVESLSVRGFSTIGEEGGSLGGSGRDLSAALNLNPLYEPVLRSSNDSEAATAPPAIDAPNGEANCDPNDFEREQERYEEVGVACCLPCRRRRSARRKLSGVGMELRSATVRVRPLREAASAAEIRLLMRANPLPMPPPRARGIPLPSTPGPTPQRPPLEAAAAAASPLAVAAASAAGSSGVNVGPDGSLNSVHSQIDFQHHFIPDLEAIYSSPYYWGVMDRFEAGEVLSNKPAGSFLLRDSAQSNFLFSISFRGYGRTLHARVDVYQHFFSLDCCDPQVAKSATVMGLMSVYQHRDGIPSDSLSAAQVIEAGLPLPAENAVHPISIYEPTLKQPVFRCNPFSLQDLARATLCSHFSYDEVQRLCIPCHLRSYMNYYHYKHPVRVRDVWSESSPRFVE